MEELLKSGLPADNRLYNHERLRFWGTSVMRNQVESTTFDLSNYLRGDLVLEATTAVLDQMLPLFEHQEVRLVYQLIQPAPQTVFLDVSFVRNPGTEVLSPVFFGYEVVGSFGKYESDLHILLQNGLPDDDRLPKILFWNDGDRGFMRNRVSATSIDLSSRMAKGDVQEEAIRQLANLMNTLGTDDIPRLAYQFIRPTRGTFVLDVAFCSVPRGDYISPEKFNCIIAPPFAEPVVDDGKEPLIQHGLCSDDVGLKALDAPQRIQFWGAPDGDKGIMRKKLPCHGVKIRQDNVKGVSDYLVKLLARHGDVPQNYDVLYQLTRRGFEQSLYLDVAFYFQGKDPLTNYVNPASIRPLGVSHLKHAPSDGEIQAEELVQFLINEMPLRDKRLVTKANCKEGDVSGVATQLSEFSIMCPDDFSFDRVKQTCFELFDSVLKKSHGKGKIFFSVEPSRGMFAQHIFKFSFLSTIEPEVDATLGTYRDNLKQAQLEHKCERLEEEVSRLKRCLSDVLDEVTGQHENGTRRIKRMVAELTEK